MSGIYPVVWDKNNKDCSAILRTTKDGYPHATLAYTGNNLQRDVLVKVSEWVMQEWAGEEITLTEAYRNTFTDRDGNERHDVLMKVGETAKFEKSREV